MSKTETERGARAHNLAAQLTKVLVMFTTLGKVNKAQVQMGHVTISSFFFGGGGQRTDCYARQEAVIKMTLQKRPDDFVIFRSVSSNASVDSAKMSC